MAEKVLKARLQQKHDTQENWNKAENFKPYDGEMIIYNADSAYQMPRIKIGDGATVVKDLPFFYENIDEAELYEICATNYNYINQVALSINSDKTIYNGGLGYKNGYRIRSGGAEGALACSAHTGFIPVKGGDVIRIGGMNFGSTHSHGSAMNVADSNFANIGQFSMTAGNYGIFLDSYKAYDGNSVVQEMPGVWKWIVPPTESGVAYIRVSCNMYDTSKAADGSLLIVTINEPIKYY